MADIALSSGVRSNLVSLQGIASLLTSSQERLATGKRVNSALDNPSNFFTAQGFNDRATRISSVLDNLATGVSTIKSANSALETQRKLIDTARSIVEQSKKTGGYTAFADTGEAALTVSAGATGTSIQQRTLTSNISDSGVANGETLIFTATKNGVQSSYTFTAGAATTVQQLVDAVNGSGVANAKVNENGTLTFEARDATAFTITGTGATGGELGFTAFNTASTTVTGDGVNYQAQLDDVISQITNLARDAGFNGTNLLQAANNLTLQLDDVNATSTTTITSGDFSATGLGIGALTLAGGGADAALTALTAANNTVKAKQSEFGNKLAVIQARQDLGKTLANELKTAAGNLTNADQNEEAANVLALQTRQSLAQSALSLANQADQAVLQLLR